MAEQGQQEKHVREGSMERISGNRQWPVDTGPPCPSTQHEVWNTPAAGGDDNEQPSKRPGIYRGESLLGFLKANQAEQSLPMPSVAEGEATPKRTSSMTTHQGFMHRMKNAIKQTLQMSATGQAQSSPSGDLSIHTFKVVLALSGDFLASISFPLKPPPTASQLKAELQRQDHRGNLVIIGSNDILKDSQVFKGLQPGGETDIGLIRGTFIEVHEAGYYNGVYEQMETNEGRPAFRMVKAHNARAGERYIYYSSVGCRIVPGWKFNDRYVPKVSEWDMLAPAGPAKPGVDDDIPEGKFRLDNGGTNTKPNAPRITKSLTSGVTQEDNILLARTAAVEEQENIEGTEAGGCFGGDAKLTMADGSYKQARDVRVGDLLKSASDGCTTTKVEACVVEARDRHQVVQLGDLLITPHHPVVRDGRWTLPADVQGAKHIDADMELYNFITTNREAIHVEGFVATSIGTYCKGLHDIEQNAEHRIWGTDAIVRIYQQHPQWPNITSATEEIMAAVEAAKEGASYQWRSHENSPAKACVVTEKNAGTVVERQGLAS